MFNKKPYTIHKILGILIKNRLKDSNDCWLWTGCKRRDGYVNLKFHGRMLLLHRFIAYVCLGYDLNDDYNKVLHKCDVRSCFNPLHLFIGTSSDNMYDMYRKGRQGDRSTARPPTKSHCKRGHALIGANVYISYKGRHCKECMRAASKRHYLSRKKPAKHESSPK